jgi:3-oxoacyl-[acyl-carrier protein] reductase
MRLTNKLAIITGAGSGFGAGIARRFAEEGCRVVVNDIDAKSGERVAKEIHGSFIQADVTKGADWARLVRAAGPALDIVVNNAGWTHRNKPYLEVSEAEFDKVYAVKREKRLPLRAARGPGVQEPRRRLLRQHRLHRRHPPAPGPHGLQQLEGRGDPDVQVDGRRVRPGQDPGELRESGVQPRHEPVGRVRRRRA